MYKNYIIIVGLLIVLVLAGGGVFWWLTAPKSTPTPAETELTPTPSPEPEPTPTPTKETKSDLEKIKEAFAEKYDKDISEVEVTISKNTGTHASGSVSFAGEMGGGMWLAYKDGEDWVITYDGHGTIPCSAVDPYEFPSEMAPECWNEATGELVNR